MAPHAGQTTDPTSNEEVLDRMRNEIRKVKALTDKPFGVPFILSYNLAMIPLMVDLFIEERVPVVLDNGLLDPKFMPNSNKQVSKSSAVCPIPT